MKGHSGKGKTVRPEITSTVLPEAGLSEGTDYKKGHENVFVLIGVAAITTHGILHLKIYSALICDF